MTDSYGALIDGERDVNDIEWQVASVDTVLFGLLDQLHQEKQGMTGRERQQPSTGVRPLAGYRD